MDHCAEINFQITLILSECVLSNDAFYDGNKQIGKKLFFIGMGSAPVSGSGR